MSPQIVSALGQASTLIATLKILKNEAWLTPALADGVNASKSALNNLDETLNNVLKMTGKGSKFDKTVNLYKTAEELVPGSIKRSKSWDSGLASYTYKELLELAAIRGKQSTEINKKADKMVKLIEESIRLLEKNKNK